MNRILLAILAILLTVLILQMSCDIRRIRARLEAGRYCTRCHMDPKPLWNSLNASTAYYNYSVPVRGVIWNPSNPSSDVCSTWDGLNLAPEGAVLNTTPDSEPTRFNPSCWTCHGEHVYGFGSATTAMAHGGGNPVTYGGKGH